MKCKHCGSEWTTTVSTAVCPFCQKPLQENTSRQQTMTDVLVQIRSISGVETLGNGRAVISSFKDLAPNLKKECTMLSYLEKCGGIKELYAARNKAVTEQNVAMTRVIDRLTNELMVSETAAKDVCKIYLRVLCGREKEAEREALIAAEEKTKVEAAQKAKLAAELTAKLAAEKKAKEEAEERKAKAEAEKKAKEEAEKKAKAEAEKKAKAEAERKAKEEAEKKVKAELVQKPKQSTPKTAAPKPVQSSTKKASQGSGTLMDMCAGAMWVIWPIAVLLYVQAVEDMDMIREPVVYLALILSLAGLFGGRVTMKTGEKALGGVYIVAGSVLLTVLTMDFYDDDQWVPIMICVLCAITGICNGLEAAEKS